MEQRDRSDRRLGMDRAISRRDFLDGVGVVAAGALVPGCVGPPVGKSTGAAVDTLPGYPPVRSGLRGSHAGSFEVAHELAFRGRQDWGSIHEPDSGLYDLVVVGAGISGLSAAYLQLQKDPSARILILDNHDDFGGHAKRNEFRVGDRTVIAYGGSQTLESPQNYSDSSKKLLRDSRGAEPECGHREPESPVRRRRIGSNTDVAQPGGHSEPRRTTGTAAHFVTVGDAPAVNNQQSPQAREHDVPLAIIGISCIFPGADGLEEYWHNIRNGVDAITDVPETHWSPDDYFSALGPGMVRKAMGREIVPPRAKSLNRVN